MSSSGTTGAAAGAAGTSAPPRFSSLPFSSALLKRLKEEPSDASMVENHDFSNSDLEPRDLLLFSKALLAHANLAGSVYPLGSLNLSNCNICGAAFGGEPETNGLSHLLKTMAKNRYLRYLNLSDNIIPDAGLKCISEFLETSTSIIELKLRRCGITDSGIVRFCHGMSRNRNLYVLDLSNNRFQAAGAECLMVKILDNNGSDIHTLRLSGNRIGPDGGKRVARIMLRLPRPLHALAMDGCALGDDGGSAIAKAMRANRIVEQLDLSDNGMTANCMGEWAIALAKNQKLTFLNLSWNRIGNDGAAKLAPGLEANNVLRTINLLGNNIDPTAASTLIESSMILNAVPVDLDIEYAPPRNRQAILVARAAAHKLAIPPSAGDAELQRILGSFAVEESSATEEDLLAAAEKELLGDAGSSALLPDWSLGNYSSAVLDEDQNGEDGEDEDEDEEGDEEGDDDASYEDGEKGSKR